MHSIPRSELELTFARSGGPGGQNVNKVSSKVLLRWRPAESDALPAEVKQRLLEQQRHRLTGEGDLLITSQRTRDQAKNIEDCLQKLAAIVAQAAQPPKKRKKTRPSKARKEERLRVKRQRSQVKSGRRRLSEE